MSTTVPSTSTKTSPKTTTKTSTNGDNRRAREAAVATVKAPRGSVRRRWGRIGVGAAAAVLGAWVFAALYLSAGDRTDVLVMAHTVDRLDVIDASDFRVVRLSNESDVESIDAGRLDEFVGRVAGVDLVAGSLLAEGQVLGAGRQLLAEGEAVVGVLLGPGDSPVRSLRRGAPVLVVVRPAAGTRGDPVEIAGWVFDASGEALNTRERPVELAVPRGQAALISAAAADQRVTLVALAE